MLQLLLRRQRQETLGQPRQVPEQRRRLAAIGIEAGLVEIGRREARVVGRQEAPGAVVEALAGDVDVVGVEHAVNEAGGQPLGTGPRDVGDHPLQERHRARRLVVAPCIGHVGLHGIVEQPAQARPVLVVGEALEGADADVRVAEPDQDRRAGRRRLVVARQLLTGLDQAEGLGGVDPQGLEHRAGEQLAHAALERQPTVTAT